MMRHWATYHPAKYGAGMNTKAACGRLVDWGRGCTDDPAAVTCARCASKIAPVIAAWTAPLASERVQ